MSPELPFILPSQAFGGIANNAVICKRGQYNIIISGYQPDGVPGLISLIRSFFDDHIV